MRDDYPLLRASLASPYAELDGEALGELVESIYGPGATSEDVENFFNDVGRGFKKAAGAVGTFTKNAVPGMLKGAMTGASVGGPWGAIVGAVAGGAGGALSQSTNKTARDIGGAIGGIGNLISSVRGGGAAGGLSGILSKVGGGGAAGGLGSIVSKFRGGRAGAGVSDLLSTVRGSGTGGGGLGALTSVGTGALSSLGVPGPVAEPGGGGSNALLALIGRPEIAQAILASAMGAYGNQSVAVGDLQIPTHDLLSALSRAAGQAAQEAAELDESAAECVPAHVEWAEAAFGIDPDAAEGRRDAVLLALALAPNVWAGQNRPITVNVAMPEPSGSFSRPDEAFLAELAEAGEADEADEADEAWAAGDAWQDSEDQEIWGSGEAGWDEEESLYAWQ